MPWRICLLGVIAAIAAGSARADDIPYATTGFGVDGVANVGAVGAVAVEPDGTIVTAGNGDDATVRLYRYSAGGKPIGKATSLSTGTNCSPGLAVRADGTLLVACGDIVATLRPNGTLRSLTSIAGAGLDAVATDDLGRPLAAGIMLVRLHVDGSIDPTFTRSTLPSPAEQVVVDGGRLLLLAGGSILGYEDDGKLDTSFGHDGIASFAGFTGTSIGAYSHWIYAGGVSGDHAAVVRYFAGGAVDASYGTGGIATLPLDRYTMSEEVVALGVRTDGAIDAALLAVHVADVYNSYENPEEWLVQRVTFTGQLDVSATGAFNYIDPTMECLQAYPVALAEQGNGKTLVTGVACEDAVDYTTYYLLERLDQALQPDVGVALHARVTDLHAHRHSVTVHVGINGPCRLIARIQQLDGNTPTGSWLSPTSVDVARGPALIRLRLKRNELRPHVRYAVVVSAYDARGYYTNARALLTTTRS